MKIAKSASTSPNGNSSLGKRKANPKKNVFDTIVKEGDLISFAPTGERIRIAKIDGEEITFEKSP